MCKQAVASTYTMCKQDTASTYTMCKQDTASTYTMCKQGLPFSKPIIRHFISILSSFSIWTATNTINLDPEPSDTRNQTKFKAICLFVLFLLSLASFAEEGSSLIPAGRQELKLVGAQFEFISRQLLTLLTGRSRVRMQIQPKQYCSNKLHTAGHLPHANDDM